MGFIDFNVLASEKLTHYARMSEWLTKYVILHITVWFLCPVGCGCNNSTRIFGPKWDVMREGWRKLHKEEFRNLYSSPNAIRMIESMRTRWGGHVARIERRRRRMHIEF
jgi:hypothetical protein